MSWTDNPIADYASWDYEQSLKEKLCPVCEDCQEPIMDEKYWEFHGSYFCEGCVSDHAHYVDNYINGQR